MARISKGAIKEAVERYDGNVSAIARAFGVTRNTIYKYCRERYPDLWELIEDKREEWLDDIEAELVKKAKRGDTTAQIFFLKTQGKSRGYTERSEITGADGGPLSVSQIKIIEDEE